MGRKDEIIERVRAVAEPLAAQEGLELVDVQLGGSGRTELTLFIDKLPGAPVGLAANMLPASDAPPAALGGAAHEHASLDEPLAEAAGAEDEAESAEDEAAGEASFEIETPEPGSLRPGVTLDDCANFSHIVSAALDVEDPLEGAYELVVSSPGLDRPLRTPAHYEKYKGKRARIKTFAPVPEAGNRKTYVGTLLGYDAGKNAVLIEVDGTRFAVPRPLISKANLDPVFEL